MKNLRSNTGKQIYPTLGIWLIAKNIGVVDSIKTQIDCQNLYLLNYSHLNLLQLNFTYNLRDQEITQNNIKITQKLLRK